MFICIRLKICRFDAFGICAKFICLVNRMNCSFMYVFFQSDDKRNRININETVT